MVIVRVAVLVVMVIVLIVVAVPMMVIRIRLMAEGVAHPPDHLRGTRTNAPRPTFGVGNRAVTNDDRAQATHASK